MIPVTLVFSDEYGNRIEHRLLYHSIEELADNFYFTFSLEQMIRVECVSLFNETIDLGVIKFNSIEKSKYLFGTEEHQWNYYNSLYYFLREVMYYLAQEIVRIHKEFVKGESFLKIV